MDKGHFVASDKGTPQGGVISPILANVYLHYVLDLWFEKAIKAACKGFVELVRYADDFVVCFEYEHEAREFYRLLEERLAKFGLELSGDKSKIIRFGRNSDDEDGGNRHTFDFLGFTHINGKTRYGAYKLQHITSKVKLKSKRQTVKLWLKKNMHADKCKLVKQINVKLLGHYRYYGITNNFRSLDKFRYYVSKILFFFLKRRSQRKLKLTQFLNFLKHNPLAQPKIFVPLGNY